MEDAIAITLYGPDGEVVREVHVPHGKATRLRRSERGGPIKAVDARGT